MREGYEFGILLFIGYKLEKFAEKFNIYRKLRKKYFKLTNKTQREALYRINRQSDDYEKPVKCPFCLFSTRNKVLYEEHISNFHGYPKDIDLSYLVELSNAELERSKIHVEKANPTYLSYL